MTHKENNLIDTILSDLVQKGIQITDEVLDEINEYITQQHKENATVNFLKDMEIQYDEQDKPKHHPL